MFKTIGTHTVFTPPLGNDSVIFDLGAHRGEFSRYLGEFCGGTYYLAEANPILSKALQEGGYRHVWHCAVTSFDGVIDFNLSHNEEGSSLLTLPAQSAYNCVLRETIQVPARKLDSLMAEMHVSRVDVLKMDIEGAEMQVLLDLSPMSLSRIGQISVEFHSDPVFGFNLHRELKQVIRRLHDHQFACLDFSQGSFLDVLFVNRAVHSLPSPPAALDVSRVLPEETQDGVPSAS